MARTIRSSTPKPSERRPPTKPGRLFHSDGTGNPVDAHERERLVHDLIATGMPRRMIREQVAKHFNVSESLIASTITKCVREYDDEFRAHVREEKSLQKYRLERDLMRLRELARHFENPTSKVYSPATALKYWALVQRYESTWADVVGTKEPVRLAIEADIRVRESLVAVVAGMSPEAIERAAERALEARNGFVDDIGRDDRGAAE